MNKRLAKKKRTQKAREFLEYCDKLGDYQTVVISKSPKKLCVFPLDDGASEVQVSHLPYYGMPDYWHRYGDPVNVEVSGLCRKYFIEFSQK